MNRIDKAFRQLRQENKKAFIPYICYGDPDIKVTEKLITLLSNNGVDMIELGYPFSDPLADGPTIQEATQNSLKHEITVEKYLSTVKKIRNKTEIPLIIMTYYNIIFNYGINKFIEKASEVGLDGAIVPDLPVEESSKFVDFSSKRQFRLIHLISPATSKERMKKIVNKSTGFIYYVSLTGVTGARKKLSDVIETDVRFLKSLTSKPICVGFGISKPDHVKKIKKFADGIIVGSAILNILHENFPPRDIYDKVRKFVQKMVKAAHQNNQN